MILNDPINEFLLTAPGNITSFGTDQHNELYILMFGSSGGKIYRFASVTGNDDIIPTNIDYSLNEAYPNPFNPSTSFSFYIPEESNINLEVISVTGELITTLKTEDYPIGEHQVTWDATGFPSGIYFIRMRAISLVNTRAYDNTIKVVLLK
jgi:hypothetical protein